MAGLPRPATGAPVKRRVESAQNIRAPTRRPSNYRSASMAPPSRLGAISPTDSIASTGGPRRKQVEDSGAEETNIVVVVRCRGRNEREVKENSGVVLSTTGVSGSTLELSMGPNALSNKTYQFDKVFSPSADQVAIYKDVVTPILDEMIAGFNCTIFAYGQTGTGKTYTMSGDMTDTLGMLSDNAGIIPRVLYALFDKLEGNDTDTTVKCSFIELYNEELRDLISVDEKSSLKIYEKETKGHIGTYVQGIEEAYIKSGEEGVKLLQKGSYKRQVAATKCNDLSSRSHTVFTVSVHVKRVAENGEEYVSVGKLNLVDLAGSENIQRSGAENKRAAEAGLINKSLLTLGRVINALVDKNSHIPYRESKLTRLLQDSLGGRTKTCIIATVSPAKSNLEETISTLDYAFRAKNIRNKPQVNQLINKKTLLKEYASEVESLKRELVATRQRNGVYMSNEAHEQMTLNAESARILNEEQTAKIEAMELNLRNKVQDLYNLTSKLMNLKKDFEGARADLDKTKDVLEQTEFVLADTRKNLDEETVLREAHQQTEEKLAKIGSTLISTVEKTVDHVSGLHAKIKRKSDLQSINRSAWGASQSEVSDITSLVENRVVDLKAHQEELMKLTSAKMQAFVKEELEKLAGTRAFLGENVQTFEASRDEVTNQTESAKVAMSDLLDEIKGVKSNVAQNVGQGFEGLKVAAERISEGIVKELEKVNNELTSSWQRVEKDISETLSKVIDENKKHVAEIESLRKRMYDASVTVSDANELAHMSIKQTMAEEREQAKTDRKALMQMFEQMLEAQAHEAEMRFGERMVEINGEIRASGDKFSNDIADVSRETQGWVEDREDEIVELQKKRVGITKGIQKSKTNTSAMVEQVKHSAANVHEETCRIIDAQLSTMSIQMSAFDDFVTRAKSENASHHTQHAASLSALSSTVSKSYSNIGNHFTESYDRVKNIGDEMSKQADTISATLSPIYPTLRQPLAELRDTITSTNLQEYQVTGQTPAKQNYVYPKQLPRTQPTAILAKMRGEVSTTPQISPSKASFTPAQAKAVYNDENARVAESPLVLGSIDEDAETNFNNENGTLVLAPTSDSNFNVPKVREISANVSGASLRTFSQSTIPDLSQSVNFPLSCSAATTAKFTRSQSVEAECEFKALVVSPRGGNNGGMSVTGVKRGATSSLLRQPSKKRGNSVVSEGRENEAPLELGAGVGTRRRSPRNAGV